MAEKSKAFREFHEDATDRGWSLVGETSEVVYGYTFHESTYANGERELVVRHNADGIAMITENGESIPQLDDNASPTNEDWLDVLTVDE